MGARAVGQPSGGDGRAFIPLERSARRCPALFLAACRFTFATKSGTDLRAERSRCFGTRERGDDESGLR